MPQNEGTLSKHKVGGEDVYTQDHKPILLSGKLKEGHAAILVGSVLVLDADGIDVIGTDNTLPIIGVSNEDIPATDSQAYVNYVAHGTVKARLLKGANGGVFTDVNKLQPLGVYAI